MNLRQYGLSYEQWLAMRTAQKNRCAACNKKERGRNQHGLMALAVDHCHKSGKVRGLLCHRCNRSLGLLGDDPNRLKQLLNYRLRFA